MLSFLIDWAFGRALDKGLDVIGRNSLAEELTREAEAWASQLSDAYRGLEPRSLVGTFISHHPAGGVAVPARNALKEEIDRMQVPAREQWFAALMERWTQVRDDLEVEEAHPFFRLDQDIAKGLLHALAERLYLVCARNEDLFRSTMIALIEEIRSNQAHPPGTPFYVPYLRNSEFVGRSEDLVRLHELVYEGTTPVGIRPTVLVGLGGIGKTQLVVEYAYRHCDDYSGGIFWINAVNPLLKEFAAIAESLGRADRETPLAEAAREAGNYLDAHPSALVIFDNVIEPDELNTPVVSGLIPAGLRCRTLFTTRQRSFPRGFEPFEVKVLPEPAAMRLLLRDRPEVLEEHHTEWGTARIVCASLGWLPLALELAAAYLGNYSEVSLRGYLERLRSDGKLETVDDTEVRAEELPTRHETAVTATLHTQWARLEDDDAKHIFRAAGQFPEATWVPVARLGLLTGIDAEAKPGHHAPLSAALRKLHVVSLIEELTDDRLRLHPLVQEFAERCATPNLRTDMAQRVHKAYADLAQLEHHVIRRDIDAVLEDVRTGLWLGEGSDTDPIVVSRLATLERVLGLEIHSLRTWDKENHPSFFLQQLLARAHVLNIGDIVAAASTELRTRSHSYLRLRWRTRREGIALVRTLSGHTMPVFAVAVTRDGRRVISASDDHTVRVWHLGTGQHERTLIGHTESIITVAVTASGHTAVTASYDKTVRLWDLQTGREERKLAEYEEVVISVITTPDGERVIGGCRDGALRVWNLSTGQLERTLPGHAQGAVYVTVTPDGHCAVSAGKDNTIRVWNLQAGRQERVMEIPPGSVFAVAVTPDGRRVVAGSDKTVCVWDVESGQLERTLTGHEKDILALTVTPDGRHVVSGSVDRTIRVWSFESGRELKCFTGHAMWVAALAVTPDGRQVISGSYDADVFVWNLALDSNDDQSSGHDDSANKVLVSGHRVVSCSDDKTIKVWDRDTGKEKRVLRGHTSWVRSMVFFPDGVRIASGSRDNTIRLWNVETGKALLTLSGHTSFVRAIALTPDGQRLVSVSNDCTVRVWDVTTGQQICSFKHSAQVSEVAITPDGRWVLSGARDNTVQVWSLEDENDRVVLEGHLDQVCSLACTRDSRLVLFGYVDGTVRVWDLLTRAEKQTLTGHDKRVVMLAVTPDGRRVVSGSADCTLRVWDLESGELAYVLSHVDIVTSVDLAPDGSLAVSGDMNGSIRVWDLTTGRELAYLMVESRVESVAFASDGRTIVAGDLVGNVYSLNLENLVTPR